MTTPYERFRQLMDNKGEAPQTQNNPPQQPNKPPSNLLLTPKNPTQPPQQQKQNSTSNLRVPQITNQNSALGSNQKAQVQHSEIKIDNRNYFKQRVQSSPAQEKYTDFEAKSERKLPDQFKRQEFSNFKQVGGDISQLFVKGVPKAQFFGGRGKGNQRWNRNNRFSTSSDRVNEEKLLVFELVGDDVLQVTFNHFFDAGIKDLIKATPTAKYSSDTRAWTLDLKYKDELIQKISQNCFKLGVKISDTPDFAYRFAKQKYPFENCRSKFQKYASHFNYLADLKFDYSLEKLPESFRDNLYQFQKEGIEYGVSRFGRFLLGDEMGVGKSLQSLAVAYLYKDEWPLFILSPASLRLTWRDEIMKWFPKIKENQIQVIKKGSEDLKLNSLIYIMSYDLAHKKQKEMQQRDFKVFIADEVHYLKSRDAKRSKVLIPILTAAKRVILISGTPMLNRPVELFNILKILKPDIVDSFGDYAGRYCNPQQTPYGIKYDGNMATQELHFILRRSIMIRRLKKDVLDQLPSKRRQKIEITVDKSIRSQLNKKMNKELDIDPFQALNQAVKQTTFEDYFNQLGEDQEDEKVLDNLYRMTGESKVGGICEFIENLIENDCKFLLFAHHQSVLDGIESYVKKQKVEYVRIDGKVNATHRHERVQNFQNNDNVRIALLSITACSQGLTLTAASTVVFAELFWTPSLMTQAEDRAHRIGQQNCVNIYYLYGRNTLDDAIFGVLSDKSQVVSDAIDGMQTDYKIIRAEREELIEEVKEMKEKGTLNPVISRTNEEEALKKGKQSSLEKYFPKKDDLDNVAKRKPKKQDEESSEEEKVDESSSEDDELGFVFGNRRRQAPQLELNKTAPVIMINDEEVSVLGNLEDKKNELKDDMRDLNHILTKKTKKRKYNEMASGKESDDKQVKKRKVNEDQ